MNPKNNVFDTNITFSKGIGDQRASLMASELGIATYRDMLHYYPFRYEDRTTLHTIPGLSEQMPAALLKGKIVKITIEGAGAKKRLTALFSDGHGTMELVWFRAIAWHQKNLNHLTEYMVYGKPVLFSGKWSITHPEIESLTPGHAPLMRLTPVYHLTEKLRKSHIENRALGRAVESILERVYPLIPETLPRSLLEKYKLVSKRDAIVQIHIPSNEAWLRQARRRLKFEELFYNQLQLIKNKFYKENNQPGAIFENVSLVQEFYENHLPFELTGAQKRVIKEIRNDLRSGLQMNRLLQGDVGSGKTIVAFITALMAIGNNYQACLMAPTEILAEQHYISIKKLADTLGLNVGKLMGSTRKSERKVLHEGLRDGSIGLLVGTHALIEDEVIFQNLGLCIIDEQHRFGVAQRARLQKKNERLHPHILVMTATPIPRTLAMTLYGDLDQSEIDELPPGRKPIKTLHRFDKHRVAVLGFIREQLAEGRQAYIVYPLIEESEKTDLKDLMDGYDSITRAFPGTPVSILHGKMKARDKAVEMDRFARSETKILVATTVIEVGVNVPNASVMIIENAERFGLAQLHQLRGRVGRGADQSYCILMSSYKLSADTKKRLETMCRTNNGFEIAQADLELRGPGDLTGTQQSGAMEFKMASLATDGPILKEARKSALAIFENDPDLSAEDHKMIRLQLQHLEENTSDWSNIS